MAPKKETKITREEELLLEGFNKNVSTKSSALFYGNAFIVSAIPVWLYWRVHSIDITTYAVIFAIGTLVSTWLPHCTVELSKAQSYREIFNKLFYLILITLS